MVPEDCMKDLQAELKMLKQCKITVKFPVTLQVLEGWELEPCVTEA